MREREVFYGKILVRVRQECNPCNKNLLHCFIFCFCFIFRVSFFLSCFSIFFPMCYIVKGVQNVSKTCPWRTHTLTLFRFSVVEDGFRSTRTPFSDWNRMGNSSFLRTWNEQISCFILSFIWSTTINNLFTFTLQLRTQSKMSFVSVFILGDVLARISQFLSKRTFHVQYKHPSRTV